MSPIRIRPALAGAFAALALGGCSTFPNAGAEINASADPQFDFAAAKTYRWDVAQPNFRPDPLLEANVRYLAERALQARGKSASADKAELLIGIGYDFSYRSMSYGNELRALTLNISRTDNRAPVWRGLAAGSINSDAASDDLKNAVEAMLARLP